MSLKRRSKKRSLKQPKFDGSNKLREWIAKLKSKPIKREIIPKSTICLEQLQKSSLSEFSAMNNFRKNV